MWLALENALGNRSLPRLAGTTPIPHEEAARVSIVVAARNEERHIEAAVRSLLAQEYPAFEVIAVDDRSTDRTGAILERLAAAGGPLRVLRLTELPRGWLGKNHALHRGAELAEGELLLFTDADVVMRTDALARGVALLEREGLDHLAVAPRIGVGGPWATMTVAVFLALFSVFFKPWKARDPESRHHIGIGAFNLVRAAAYSAIGGHAGIALRPDDDVRLGRRLKEAGHAQAAALGPSVLDVEWYPSLRAMARGFRKNAFAAVDYRFAAILVGTALPLVLVFWPVAALALTDGLVRALNAAVVVVSVAGAWDAARVHRLPRWVALTYPLGSLLLLWIVWSATVRALASGGIEWRDTRYPLEELRRG